jgi:choline kinase
VPISEKFSYLDLTLKSLAPFVLAGRIVVTGFAAKKLEDFFATRGFSGFELVHNPDFEKGNLYSLLAAKSFLSKSFFIFNADHFYAPSLYQKIFSCEPRHITIFCDRDRHLGDDDMKVALSLQNGAQRLTMAKTLQEFQWGYVGVTGIPESKHRLYWQACEAVAQEWGEKAHVEHVIKFLGERGEPIDIVDLSGSWWTEIDTPEDYQKARQSITDHWPEIVAWMESGDGSRV